MAVHNFLLFGLFFNLFLQTLAVDKDVFSGIGDFDDPNALYESNRNLFNLFDLGLGSVRAKCSTIVNRPSSVIPNQGIVLTRLANNRLYFFSTIAAPFATARQFCAEHGMHLVTINGETENSLVLARAQALGIAGVGGNLGAWIGLHDVGISNFRWVQDNSASAFNFFTTQPASGSCIQYIILPNPAQPPRPVIIPTLSWAGVPCNTPLFFICELEPPCSTVLQANRV